MPKKKSVKRRRRDHDSIDEEIDFETSLEEVEQIVARLEAGELGLSESLAQYERGIQQLKRCHALLASAEQRVSVLSGFDADGNPILGPLNDSSGESDSSQNSEEGGHTALKRTQQEQDSVDDIPGLF